MPSNNTVKSIVNTIAKSNLKGLCKVINVLITLLERNANENGYTADNISSYAEMMAYIIADMNRGISQKYYVVVGQKLKVKIILNDSNGIESAFIFQINLGGAGSIFTIDSSGDLPVIDFVPLITFPETSVITDLADFKYGCETSYDSFE